MPAKPKNARVSPKQRRKPARRTKLPLFMVPPKSKKVCLCFPSDSVTITESAVSGGAFRYYRLNSAYDVDTGVGSTNTPGFNEWSAFFNNYRVWRTHVRVEGGVSGGSSGALATVGLVPNSFQATLPSSKIYWISQPGVVHQTISQLSNGGRTICVLDKQYSLPTIFRITKRQFMDDMDFTATTGSNPSRQAYVAVTLNSINSSTVMSFSFTIVVSMEIEFFNPIQLST